jgi:hypothetical protein
MATLFPDNPLEVAFGTSASPGSANFTVDSNSFSPRLEIWERTIPFPPRGSTPPAPPPFTLRSTVASRRALSEGVPLGELYQVRLFRDGEGDHPLGTGNLLGKLDFPCFTPDLRANFLTKCADRPQVDIVMGGTFAFFAFASSKPVMFRIQLGVTMPILDPTTGLPFFAVPGDVAASAVSLSPKLLHNVTLIDELLQGDTTGHSPLLPGNTFYYIVLVWDENGSWDCIWNTTGAVPVSPPEKITAKKRSIEVAFRRILIIDDSDDLSDGEGEFELFVYHGGNEMKSLIEWENVASGENLPFRSRLAVFNIPPEVVSRGTKNVAVSVEGYDDDSGSVPPDSNDLAETGRVTLDFPVGSGQEEVNNRLLVLTGYPITSGEKLKFEAYVTYSVNYM